MEISLRRFVVETLMTVKFVPGLPTTPLKATESAFVNVSLLRDSMLVAFSTLDRSLMIRILDLVIVWMAPVTLLVLVLENILLGAPRLSSPSIPEMWGKPIGASLRRCVYIW